MSARLEIALRRALRGAAAAAGSPAVSAAALALAALSVASSFVWERVAPGLAAAAFATSPAHWAIAILVALNGAVGLARTLPARFDADDRLHLSLDLPSAARSLVRIAEVAVGVALVVSLVSRDTFDVRLAQGERYVAGPEQLVGGAPPRRFSRGPFAADFTIGEVVPRAADGAGAPEVVVRIAGSGATRASGSWPAWLGLGRALWPTEAGWALRYEVVDARGALVESAFAKLQLLPAGRTDALRLESTGHRVHVQLADEQPPPQALGRALRVRVFRGKTLEAGGILLPGQPLELGGFSLRFPEAARWAQFRMVDDPGVRVGLAAALLGAAGGLLLGWPRLRRWRRSNRR